MKGIPTRLLVWTILLAPAALSPVALAQSPVGRAVRAARAYWGPSRCSQTLVVIQSPQTPPAAIGGTEVLAWVTFETPLGPLNWSSPTYSDCIINLARPARSFDWQALCQIILHEYGHLVGWPDSLSFPITDIRYPVLSEANLPPPCTNPTPTRMRSFER